MRDGSKPVDWRHIQAARARLAGLALVTPVGRLRCRAAGQDRAPQARVPAADWLVQGPADRQRRARQDARGAWPRASTPRARATARSASPGWRVAWESRPRRSCPRMPRESKLEKLRRLGARIDMRSVDEWWRAIEAGALEGRQGVYIDAVRDPAASRAMRRSGWRSWNSAPDGRSDIGARSAAAAWLAGSPARCARFNPRRENHRVRARRARIRSRPPARPAPPLQTPTQAGFRERRRLGSVLPEMWPLVRALIDEVITVTPGRSGCSDQDHWLGAQPRGGGRSGRACRWLRRSPGAMRERKVCAVVSGGNIDTRMLCDHARGRSRRRSPGRYCPR